MVQAASYIRKKINDEKLLWTAFERDQVESSMSSESHFYYTSPLYSLFKYCDFSHTKLIALCYVNS